LQLCRRASDVILPDTKGAFRFARERDDEVQRAAQPAAAPPHDQLTSLIVENARTG
jgi:hypothetical protein